MIDRDRRYNNSRLAALAQAKGCRILEVGADGLGTRIDVELTLTDSGERRVQVCLGLGFAVRRITLEHQEYPYSVGSIELPQATMSPSATEYLRPRSPQPSAGPDAFPLFEPRRLHTTTDSRVTGRLLSLHCAASAPAPQVPYRLSCAGR